MTYYPIVQELVGLIDENNWGDEFKLAVGTAIALDIPTLKHIESLDDYLEHINSFLRWRPEENQTGKRVYDEICTFYFILDQISVNRYQSPIVPSSRSLTALSKWIVDYANELGKWYDDPDSISPQTVATFYASPRYRMEDYLVPEGGWKTFNEFFARHVKPGLREPDAPGYNTVVVSPADSVFDGCWKVDDENNVFFVKGLPWNIKELLDGSSYAEKFTGGTFMHAFLNTTDYHRQHAPVTGIVREAKVIQGAACLEVCVDSEIVSDDKGNPQRENRLLMRRGLRRPKHPIVGALPSDPSTKRPVKELDAPDHPGYQFLQSRGLIVLETDIGWVAVLPIGMAQVSSVVLNENVVVGGTLDKGAEISHFQFGGSDIVLVFGGSTEVKFLTEVGKHNNAGKMIARAQHIQESDDFTA